MAQPPAAVQQQLLHVSSAQAAAALPHGPPRGCDPAGTPASFRLSDAAPTAEPLRGGATPGETETGSGNGQTVAPVPLVCCTLLIEHRRPIDITQARAVWGLGSTLICTTAGASAQRTTGSSERASNIARHVARPLAAVPLISITLLSTLCMCTGAAKQS